MIKDTIEKRLLALVCEMQALINTIDCYKSAYADDSENKLIRKVEADLMAAYYTITGKIWTEPLDITFGGLIKPTNIEPLSLEALRIVGEEVQRQIDNPSLRKSGKHIEIDLVKLFSK